MAEWLPLVVSGIALAVTLIDRVVLAARWVGQQEARGKPGNGNGNGASHRDLLSLQIEVERQGKADRHALRNELLAQQSKFWDEMNDRLDELRREIRQR